jgi:hypothetical protein
MMLFAGKSSLYWSGHLQKDLYIAEMSNQQKTERFMVELVLPRSAR